MAETTHLDDRESAIDRVAREAASDLRAVMLRAPLHPPSRPRTRTRTRTIAIRAFAVTATVALVLLGLVVLVRRDPVVPSVSGPPSLEWVVDLDGWPSLGGHIIEPDPTVDDPALVRSVTYATDAAPDGPIVVIDWSAIDDQTYVDPDNDVSVGSMTDVESITIGGQAAVIARTWQGNRVLFVHAAGQTARQWVRLTGRRITDDDLIELSTRLTIDVEHQLRIGGEPLPDGLSERPGWIMEEVDPAVAAFSYSRYGADPIHASIELSTRSETTSVTARLGLDAGALEAVDVNGAPGFYVANIGGGGAESETSAITWKADGLEFLLGGQAVDRETLLAAARSVRSATADEWTRMVATYGDPCDLLTADEVSTTLHVTASPGTREHAIGETDENICAYPVTGPLRTVTVYLGHGIAPRTSSIHSDATESRDDVYVVVGAQFPNNDFFAGALQLARAAIDRAAPG